MSIVKTTRSWGVVMPGLVALVGCLALAGTARPAEAQMQGPSSPPATASATVAGKAISIRYSAPSVRGRQIFGAGGLLSQDPTYPVWRAGANEATTLTTEASLEIGALRVPPGRYSLWVLVEDPNAWQLIVNRQTGQTGLEYDPSQDVGRVPMRMSAPASPVERLAYTLTDQGGGRGELRLEWERHVAVVPFTAR